MYNEKTQKYEGYIYCITNDITLEGYIGQTTKTIEERFSDHKRATKNRTGIMYLYDVVEKYGWDLFSVDEVEKIESNTEEELKQLLNEKEIFYINDYNTLFPNGYNISKGGWLLPNTFETCCVYKFDLNGNLIQKYDSMRDAAFNNNVSQADISNCCNGKKVATVGGFYWSKQPVLDKSSMKVHPLKRRISVFTKDNRLINTFDSIMDGVMTILKDRTKYSMVCKVLSNGEYFAHGYIWKFIDSR